MISARTIPIASAAATLAVPGAGSAPAVPQTSMLQVSVVDTTGAAVANANICVDSARSGARLGEGRSNAAGQASIAVGAESAAEPVGSPVTPLRVTASAGSSGVEVQSGGLAMVTLRLPRGGGPRCVTGQIAQATPGQAPLNRAAVRDGVAALPERPQFEFVKLGRISERCFGAAGQNCSDQPGETGTCDPRTQTCMINVGSWKHDECCVRNPRGGMCGLDIKAPFGAGGIGNASTICQAEFNMALERLPTPFSWRRRVDFSRVNTSGTVEHAAYCAPSGTLMAEGEERYCCSGRVRVLASAERLALPARVLSILPARDIRACAAS